ncbi:autoinducer binding domain-containing protein [Glaciimonas soli]|uniref:LuxR family transcriptional regulator n=1 Tax=Glaciimonas soli TaxID=2590999 RepID=A0A843YU51_9BURK|nr:autoinducer binding domain-containing protein [Glaciimonas soli]MQR00861.1 LuxR family transcriptional regulator [Glaciimonas soli]
MLSWEEEQIQSLLSAKTETAFFAVLSRIALKLGFDYCAFGMRLPLPIADPKVITLNNYSTSWQQRYTQENYIAVDPTVSHGMKSTLPLVWSDEVFSKSRAFWEDAQSHGLRIGWAQSCHDRRGVSGLLSLARSNDQFSISELNDISLKMSWLTQAAQQGLSRLLVPKFLPEANADLTPREIEVLRWTADGKTSNEVGDIMHISERTVNFHVTNALIKLNAPNKTAAAIKAAMLGML